jgi:hypothetical protein
MENAARMGADALPKFCRKFCVRAKRATAGLSRLTPPERRTASLGRNLPVVCNCPFRIMCMNSTPVSVAAAERKDLDPSAGRTTRLIARWSCSTMLFRYCSRSISMSASFSTSRASGVSFWRAVLTDRSAQEPQCRFVIALGGQQEVRRGAALSRPDRDISRNL